MIPLHRKFLVQMKKDSSVITIAVKYTAIDKTEEPSKLIVLPTRSFEKQFNGIISRKSNNANRRSAL
jgi:hypothetical protein